MMTYVNLNLFFLIECYFPEEAFGTKNVLWLLYQWAESVQQPQIWLLHICFSPAMNGGIKPQWAGNYSLEWVRWRIQVICWPYWRKNNRWDQIKTGGRIQCKCRPQFQRLYTSPGKTCNQLTWISSITKLLGGGNRYILSEIKETKEEKTQSFFYSKDLWFFGVVLFWFFYLKAIKVLPEIIVFSGKWLMNWINNNSRKCKANICPTVIYSSVSNSKPKDFYEVILCCSPQDARGSSPAADWPERLTLRHMSWPVPTGMN